MRKFLIKLDRVAAWVLLIGVLLYFITGYGMTKGIFSPQLSNSLHLDVLVYIVLIAFFIHAPYAIHLALKRWNFWNLFSKIFLILFFMAFASFIVYAEGFYIRQQEAVSTEMVPVAPAQTEAEPEDKTFTTVELAQYDGQDGQPAYVAVDGNVYDLTGVFSDGFHYSHFAGQDLTNAFYSKHAKNALNGYPIIGTLKP